MPEYPLTLEFPNLKLLCLKYNHMIDMHLAQMEMMRPMQLLRMALDGTLREYMDLKTEEISYLSPEERMNPSEETFHEYILLPESLEAEPEEIEEDFIRQMYIVEGLTEEDFQITMKVYDKLPTAMSKDSHKTPLEMLRLCDAMKEYLMPNLRHMPRATREMSDEQLKMVEYKLGPYQWGTGNPEMILAAMKKENHLRNWERRFAEDLMKRWPEDRPWDPEEIMRSEEYLKAKEEGERALNEYLTAQNKLEREYLEMRMRQEL